MRRIPIAWYGVASDVKLLGDFDSWTRGFSLSRGEIQDQTFTKFSAVITLLPVSSFVLSNFYQSYSTEFQGNLRINHLTHTQARGRPSFINLLSRDILMHMSQPCIDSFDLLMLLQGRYLVKFKIDDNHWRLAPDWPTNDSPDGNTNNVLVVA